MKRITFFRLLIACAIPCSLSAQDVSFRSLGENTRHLVGASFGADYSSYYGLSYGYVLKTGFSPVVVGAELTVPTGKEAFDDWKGRIGLQAELWKSERFSLALKPTFIMRRYNTMMATMFNLGADISLTFGYVRSKWGVVALAVYDKPFATNIEHKWLRELYPGIRDGWYGASGGNFKFGVRANLHLRSWNGFLSVGKMYAQDFKDNPTFPLFAEISIQKQLGK